MPDVFCGFIVGVCPLLRVHFILFSIFYSELLLVYYVTEMFAYIEIHSATFW